MKWFRYYNDALNDPKVQSLSAEDFRVWVNLLCVASSNNGCLRNVTETAFLLRMSENAFLTALERLLNAGLIDRVNGGANGWHYAPHNWKIRQYKSDSCNERVKRHRNAKCNVTETPPDTDTESDTDIPKKDKSSLGIKRPDFHAMLAPILGDDLARDFIQHRKELKAPLTMQATKRLVASLQKMPNAKQAVERSIENGWKGVFAGDDKSQHDKPKQPPQKPHYDPWAGVEV